MFLHLRELQGLVSEGRGVIAHQVQRNQQLLSANAATLTRNLEDLEAQAKVSYLSIPPKFLSCHCFFLPLCAQQNVLKCHHIDNASLKWLAHFFFSFVCVFFSLFSGGAS